MPDMLIDLGPGLVAILLAAGVATGLLSGLLGIGGGVVVVPVLLEVLPAAGVAPDAATRLAIGTAHAAVLLASLPAAAAHARAGRVDRGLLGAWLPGLAAGTVAGLVVAWAAPAGALVAGFAVVSTVLAVLLLLGERLRRGAAPAGARPGGVAAPAGVGLLASALGIGGGTLGGPVLALLGVGLHRAIAAGAVFNLVVSAPALAAFVVAGLGAAGRPAGSLGYVAMVPLLLLAVPAMAVAPAAARLAGRLPVGLLRQIFAGCMVAIAARLVWRLAGG